MQGSLKPIWLYLWWSIYIRDAGKLKTYLAVSLMVNIFLYVYVYICITHNLHSWFRSSKFHLLPRSCIGRYLGKYFLWQDLYERLRTMFGETVTIWRSHTYSLPDSNSSGRINETSGDLITSHKIKPAVTWKLLLLENLVKWGSVGNL